MPNYREFMMRHGEHGVLAIVEQIERVEGIRAHVGQSIEDRWDALMQPASFAPRMAA